MSRQEVDSEIIGKELSKNGWYGGAKLEKPILRYVYRKDLGNTIERAATCKFSNVYTKNLASGRVFLDDRDSTIL